MNATGHVLLVSWDLMILETRKMILESSFQVAPAGTMAEAEAMLAGQVFDLAVLCYTLSDEERQRLADLAVRQNPKPKILMLRSAGNRHQASASYPEFMIEDGPEALIKKLAEMLGCGLKSRGFGPASEILIAEVSQSGLAD